MSFQRSTGFSEWGGFRNFLYVKIHNILRLSVLCRDYGVAVPLDDDILFMDSIDRSRYTGEAGTLPLGEPGVEDAKRAIMIAERIVAG